MPLLQDINFSGVKDKFGKKSSKNKKGESETYANPIILLVGRIGIEPITY
jgi:hypothetical protein